MITPRIADRLCSLAQSQLQTQAARFASVNASALGMMTMDAAVAAIIIGVRGAGLSHRSRKAIRRDLAG